MRLIRVASLDDPDHRAALAGFANLKDRDLRAQAHAPDRADLFVAEGALVVLELLRSRFPVHSVLVAEARVGALRGGLDSLPPGTPVYVAPQAVLDSIVGFHVHRGVLALGWRLPPASADTLLRDAPGAVVLEDLTNHDNVGGVFRCVAALAPPGTPVLLSPGCCDPLYRKAVRVSIGHALRVPFATLDPWPGSLSLLADAGFDTLALSPAGGVDLGEVHIAPGRRWALVLGSEGPGLSEGALAACALRARIAMTPGVDSLNVVVAAGIALHGIARGR